VQLTDEVMPGVVSIPHGWGHDDAGAVLTIAARHAGANSNLLADDQVIDPVSGNAVLNGIPVELTPA
jgi:anaerobic selenocysteine-containing dehydrogenase